jgi:hypothetical protein
MGGLHRMTFRKTFTTPFTQFKDREGQSFKVLTVIVEPDAEHDEEVLPMYRIQFEDGEVIEAWSEEVKESPSWKIYRKSCIG